MNFKLIKTQIDDVKIFQPDKFEDSRGYLIESYKEIFFKEHLPSVDFVQHNESESSYGVIRGLHYQKAPYEQSKLVRVIEGVIQDVAVDLRKNSDTYLKYISVILSDKNRKQLYIPRGFAHGFLVLSSNAKVHYKMDGYFNQEYYYGIKYNDPKIGIKWELDSREIILSENDLDLKYFDGN